MHPHFIAPLTRRGRNLVEFIHENERRLVQAGALADEGGIHVAQEAFVQMVQMSMFRRLPRIQAFQAAMRVGLDAQGDDNPKS